MVAILAEVSKIVRRIPAALGVDGHRPRCWSKRPSRVGFVGVNVHRRRLWSGTAGVRRRTSGAAQPAALLTGRKQRRICKAALAKRRVEPTLQGPSAHEAECLLCAMEDTSAAQSRAPDGAIGSAKGAPNRSSKFSRRA